MIEYALVRNRPSSLWQKPLPYGRGSVTRWRYRTARVSKRSVSHTLQDYCKNWLNVMKVTRC